MNPHILILGGGYAGLTAASRLRRLRVNAAITLIDAKPFFVERIRLHQAAVGQALLLRSYADFLNSLEVTFVQARATRLSADQSTVRVEAPCGTASSLRYDYLIYALGSGIDAGGTPGAVEHAIPLDSPESAGRIHRLLADRTETRALIVGGGLTGLEMASELAEAFPLAQVTLATAAPLRADRAPGGFSAHAADYLRQGLERRRVALVEGHRVTALRAGVADLNDGGQLPFSVCVWASGFVAPPLARTAGLQVNARGQIVTGPSLRSMSHTNIIAIGDAADARSGDSGPCRMGCATGLAMATGGARTIASLLAGKKPRDFRFVYLFRNVSLGRGDGVIQFVDGRDVPRNLCWTGVRAARWKDYICRGTLSTIGLADQERLPSVPPLRMVPQLLRGLGQYA